MSIKAEILAPLFFLQFSLRADGTGTRVYELRLASNPAAVRPVFLLWQSADDFNQPQRLSETKTKNTDIHVIVVVVVVDGEPQRLRRWWWFSDTGFVREMSVFTMLLPFMNPVQWRLYLFSSHGWQCRLMPDAC